MQIQNHEKQINEAVKHIPMLEGKAINKMNQKQSVGGYTIKQLQHTEPSDFGNNRSRSFIDYAPRQSIKPQPNEKTRDRNERSSFTKRLGILSNRLKRLLGFLLILSYF